MVSLILHQVKEVGATPRETNSECTTIAYLGIIFNNTKFDNGHILTLQKVKILQKSQVFKCGKNHIYFRCAKLCTNQIV